MANQLNPLRKKIDQIDQKILKLLEQRFQIAEKIAHHKIKTPIRNLERENQILENWLNQSKLASHSFVSKIVKLILQESRNIQKRFLNK
jgi:chorismate mutase